LPSHTSLPLAIVTTPIGFAAIKLAGAFRDRTQTVNAGLDGHLATTFDGVDLLAKRIQPRALASIGKQLQLIAAASWCNSG
jgi:hypothetical protein